jgi:hypothetical protein
VPAFGSTPQIFPASPAPVGVNAPVAGASPQIAANSSPIPNGPCAGGDAGDAANGGMASDSAVRSDQPSRGCGAAVPNKPRGLIGFALSKLNREALVKAIDRESSEVTNVRSSARVALTFVMAGTSLGLSAGIIGWLLRGGGLLSALLTSMPLWRGFDPLPVVMGSRRRDHDDQPPSDVDRLFDDSRVDRQAASLATEFGRGYADVPGVRQGRRAGIDTSAVI